MRQAEVVAERARWRSLQRDGILKSLSSGSSSPHKDYEIERTGSLTSPSRCSPTFLSENVHSSPLVLPQPAPSEPLFPALAQCVAAGPSRLQLLKSGDGALGAVVEQCYVDAEVPPSRSVKAVAGRLSRALSKAVSQYVLANEGDEPPCLLEPIVAISARGPTCAKAGRLSSSHVVKGASLDYRVSLLDLPAEMMLLILGDMHVAELCPLRQVCIALSVLVDEIAKRVYFSKYGSLIDPFHIGTGWAPLLREAEKREKIYNLWSSDAVWMVARGMDLRLEAHLAQPQTWTSTSADAALVEAARNPLGGRLYEVVTQLNSRIRHRPNWAFVVAAALVGCNLALAQVLAATHADLEPDSALLPHVASVIRPAPPLPPFMHDTPTLRSYVFAALCTRTDDEALRTLRWLLAWKNAYHRPHAPPPSPPSPYTSPPASPPASPARSLGAQPPRSADANGNDNWFLRYRDFKGSLVPLMDVALRWKASRAAITELANAGGRPALAEFLSLVSSDNIADLWWIIAPPAYSWEELTAATATQGSEEMLAHLLAQAPKRVHKTKMLKQALTAGNRPVAEALMQVARVQDRSLLGAAIHGALYDLAYKLATRGAKCTELYNGRPLVLLLVNSSFLPAEARALLDLLLSPPDVHTQSWLSVALNVPHEGELPLCTAVSGDAALYKVTRLLQAGAKPDHSDAAGNTPLLLALKESHSENVQQVVDLLLQHGASVNARNVADESPLSVAVAQANVGLIHRLMSVGALPHVSARGGATILHTWLERYSPEWQSTRAILEAFIPRMIPAEARTHDGGDTLLHYAVKYRRRHAIDVLLMLGASPDTANQSNITALQLAQRMRLSPDVIERLKEHSQRRSTCALS